MIDQGRIGIIGDGNVGSALEEGLSRAGYEVRAVGRDPAGILATAKWAQTLILAVPSGAVDDVLRHAGDAVAGKILVDVTNVMDDKMGYARAGQESGAEALQAKARGARVVKAFNTVFAAHMSTGQVFGEKLTAFAAGDDVRAKETVLAMAKGIGFDAVDAGPLANARWLEALGILNIQLGYKVGHGSAIGLRLVREGSATTQERVKESEARRH